MADIGDNIDIEAIVRGVVAKIAGGAPPSGGAGPVNLAPDTTSYAVPPNERDDVKHVAVGADHAGSEAKRLVTPYLLSLGYEVIDAGTGVPDKVDFPEIAAAVAKRVASGECERGIMFDADGIGSAIVCNKIKGIRAALCYDMRSVVNSRELANANVMTLGGPFHGGGELCEMAKVWLEARFPSGKHWARVNGIMSIEARGMR